MAALVWMAGGARLAHAEAVYSVDANSWIRVSATGFSPVEVPITGPPVSMDTVDITDHAAAMYVSLDDLFTVNFQLHPHADGGDTASSGQFLFTPTQDVAYTLVGFAGLDISLTLAQVGGAALFEETGSALLDSGSLTGGTTYQLDFLAQYQGPPAGSPDVTGSVTLLLEAPFAPAPVPTPAAAWGGAVLLGVLGATRGLRRRQARS